MIRFTVFNKLRKTLHSDYGSEIRLAEPGLVLLDLPRSEVAGVARDADRLTVRLVNGKRLVVHGFFDDQGARGELIFDDRGPFLSPTAYSPDAPLDATHLFEHSSSALAAAHYVERLRAAAPVGVEQGADTGALVQPMARQEAWPEKAQPPRDLPAPSLSLQADLQGHVTASGKTAPGAAVTVTFPDGSRQVVTADANGHYSAQSAAPHLGSGLVTATAVSTTGQISAEASAPYVDQLPPETPELTLSSHPDGSLSVEGLAEPGSLVQVHFPGGQGVLVQADAQGRFTAHAAGAQPPGEVTATATDAAGNTSAPGEAWFSPDRPAPPSLLASDDVGAVQGWVSEGGITDDTRPLLSGNTAPHGVVHLHVDGSPPITLVADAQGHWQFTPTLGHGPHEVTAVAVDVHGQASEATQLHFSVNMLTAPSLQILDDQGPQVGGLAPGGLTDDATLSVRGTGQPGATVHVALNGLEVVTAVVDGDGHWLVALPAQPDGACEITAWQSLAGLQGPPQTTTAWIDTTPSGISVQILHAMDDDGPLTGWVGDGGILNDSTPLISGSLDSAPDAGDQVLVYRDGVLLGTASVSGTSWSFADSGLVNGSTYRYTAQVVDAAGNVGCTSSPLTLTVDTSAPGQVVTVSSYTDNVSASTGTFGTGTTTNDTTPTLNGTLSGSLVAGEVVNVYRDGVFVGTATVTGTSWTFSDTGLSSGNTYSYTTQVVDAAGNVGGTSSPLTLTVDTAAPAQAVTVSSYTDNVSASTGTFGTGTTTNDTTPTLNGTLSASLAAGEVVNVYRDGVLVGTATVTGTSWTFSDSGLANGSTHSYTAQVVDAAGNLGSASSPLTLTVDTAAPVQAVTVTGYTDDVSASTGTFGSGTTTNDTTPTLNGTLSSALAAGEVVNVYRDGVLVGTASVAGTSWTFSDVGLSSGNSYDYTVQVVDAAGNVGGTSSALTLTVDIEAPAQVVAVTGYTDNVSASTGTFGTGTTTNDTTPTLNGTLSASLAAGEVVNVYRDGVLVGTAMVTGTSWTFSDSGLSDGNTYSYTAQVVDAAGNVGSTSSPLTLTVDTSAPGQVVTVSSYTDNVSASTGTFGTGTTTNDTTPTLNGTLSGSLVAGEVVNVYRDGVFVGTATVTGTSWTFSDTGLSSGNTYSYTAQVVDAAGNVGGTSSPLTLTVDTAAPAQAVTVSSYTDNVSASTGSFGTGTTTNDTTPTLNGTLSATLAAGEVVNVYRDGVLVGTATVTGTSWTFSDSGLVNGSTHSYTAQVIDAAGNLGSASSPLTLTVDTAAPAQTVTVTGYTDDVSASTGTFGTGTTTNDTTPTLNGTLSATLAAGEVVNVYRDGVLVGTATVTGTSWTFSDSGLVNGSTHSYTAQVIDAAGNLGSASSPLTLTVDTAAPAQTVTVTGYTDDVSATTGTFGTGTTTNDTTPTLNGTLSATLAAGEVVNVYRDGVLVGTATVTGTSWTFSDSGLVSGSAYSYTAQVIDAAGNVGSASSPLTLTVDTAAPAQTVTVTGYTDNVSASTGTFGTGTTTNDTTPTLNGTLSATLAAGEVVNVYRDGVLVGTATVTGTSWTFSDSGLVSGSTYSYTAQVIDAAGNVGGTSSPLTLTVDTAAPVQAVTISSYTNDVSAITGTFGTGTTTNDTTPTLNGTLSGSLAVGEVVNIYRDGVLVGTATVTGTSWTFSDAGLSNGNTYSYTAQVIDAAGNVGSTSSPLTLTVDTAAPAQAVTVSSYTDDVSASTGTFGTGTTTNDTTPTLNGTLSTALAAGEVVNLYRDGVLVGTATVNGTYWTFSDSGLSDGNTYSYTAQVVDDAGNVGSTSSPLTLTVDTSAPGQVVTVSSYTDNVSASTGTFGTGTTTNDTTPTLNGTLSGSLVAGEVVNVYRDGVFVGTATVTGTSWTFSDAGLSSGNTYSYTAQVIDAAGNVGSTSSPLTLTVDTSAPAQAVTVTGYTDDVSASTGTFGTGTTTNDTAPTLHGTLGGPLAAGEVVNVYRDGMLVGTATVTGTSWTFSDTGLSNGNTYSYTAQVIDAAGNVGGTSSPLTLTVDTSAPAQAVTVTAYTDNVSASTGTFGTGTTTNDTTPTLNGTLSASLAAGEVVNVYRDGVLVGTATVTGTNWTFSDSGLVNGSSYSYTAQVVDVAGNVGSTSSPLTLTVDTTAPAQTVTVSSYTDDVSASTGTFGTGTTTNDTTPTLNGTLSATLAAGEVVNVYRDGVLVGTATVTGTSWTFSDSGLVNGSTYSYTAQVVDAAGNVGGTSSPFTLTLDDSAPAQTVTVTGYSDDVSASTGTFGTGTTTNDTTPTLNGTLSGSLVAGEVVNVYRDGVLIGTATVTGTSWTFSDSGLANGSTYSYTARVVDDAGNVGSASSPFTLTVDTSAPAQTVTVTGYTDDVSASSGTFGSGTTTNDTTPTLNGTLSSALAAGEVVNVYRDGVLVGTASVTGTSWTFSDAGLSNGNTYSYTAQVIDAAGNVGSTSSPLTLTVDTSAPAQAVTVTGYTDDVSASTGTFGTGTTTNDTTPTLNGTLSATLAAGEVVKVYRDGVLVGTATVTGTSWTFSDSGLVNGSTYSYTAQVIDAAGNVGSTSSPLTLTVDTSAPAQAVTVTGYTDDVSASTGTFGTGTTTNDTTPTLNGTLSASLAAGEVVNVYRDGVLVGTATVTGTSWTFSDSGLVNGSTHSYTAQVVDAAGNLGSASSPLTLTVDTAAPAQTVTVTGYTDNVSASTGTFGTGTTTNDTTPTLNGTLSASLAAGEVVNVYRDGVLVGTATVTGTSWTFSDSGLANGSTYSYTAQVIDAASNAGSTSSPFTLTVDTSAPAQAVTISSYTDDVSASTGTFGTGTTTNDTTPTLNGTLSSPLAAGEMVHVYRDGVLVGTASVTGTNWTFADSGLTSDNSYSYTAQVVDAAGNVGGTSSPLTLTVDTAAPTQLVTVSSYSDDAPASTGTLGSGTTTNDTTPTLNGTLSASLAAGEAVNLYRDGVLVGVATVTGTSWTFTDSGLASDTTYSYTAQVVDAAGNVGGVSAPLTLTVDTSAPTQTATINSFTDDVVQQTGTFGNGAYTNDTAPVLNGSLDAPLGAGEVLNVYRDGVLLGVATVSGTSWTYADSGLTHRSGESQSLYGYETRVMDAAGNLGAASPTFSLWVDTSNPNQVITISQYADDVSPNSGTFGSGTTTNDTTPVLSGTISSNVGSNRVVNIYRDGVLIGTATRSGANWTFADSGLVDGNTYTYTARLMDAAGNLGPLSSAFNITVDTTAPTQSTMIDSFTDDAPNLTGTYSSGSLTNDTTPTLNGSLSAALGSGQVVAVYRDGSFVGNATVSGTSWTFTDTGLSASGPYAYTARVQDAAGNAATTSSSFIVQLDSAAPAQSVTVDSYTDDVAQKTGTFGNNTTTNDNSPVLNGSLSAPLGAGEVLNVYRDGVLRGTATVNGTSWTYADSGVVHRSGESESSYIYTVQVVDTAGNLGPLSPNFKLTVDVTNPTQTITIANYADNVSPNTGTFGSGTTTNDTSPTLSGTISSVVGSDRLVNIFRDGVLIAEVGHSNQAWTFTDSGLVDGATYTYTARLVDAAGNLGPMSSSFTVTVDTSAPTKTSSITSYTDDVAASTGNFGSGTSTNDTAPTLNGSLSAALASGEAVQVYRDGVLLGTATVSGTSWTYADAGLANGSTYGYTTRVVDAAGNLGSASGAFTLSVDTGAPAQSVSVTGYTDDVGLATGTAGNGSVTDDTAPVINGSLSAALASGEGVNVYRNGVLVGAAQVSGTSWTFADSGLSNGNSYSYTARVVDAAGNLGAASSAMTFSVDTVAPTKTVTLANYTDDVAPQTGNFASGTSTNDTAPVINGSLSAALVSDEALYIFRNGTLLGAADVSGTSWSFAESGLTGGTTYSYTGRVADTAGNLGPASSTFSITVDTSAPAVQQLNVTGFSTDTAAGLVTGTGSTTNTATNSDRVTRDANPTLNGDYVGTLGPGDNLQISADGGSTWQTISTSASWSYTDPTARQGTVTYLVRAADAAGNAANPSGTNSLTISFDTTAPVQSLAAPVLGSAFDTGTVGDGVTTTTAITFTSSQSGKAEAGATLALVDDVNGDGIYSQGIDNVLATTTVAADGTWSLSPTLAVGNYSLAFLQVDAAGNRSRFSVPTELSVVSADSVVVSNQGWGSSGSSSNGGSAVTLSATGQWQFYNNQSVYSGNATSQSNFNSFSSVALASGGKEAGSVVFMDYNRDGNIDILTGDYVTSDGQLAWTNTGSSYTAFQVVGSGIGTNGSAAVNVTGGGIVALDKTGDGYVDLAYGDAAPGDSETAGGYDSQIVLNNAGSFIKDGSFVDTNTGSPAPTSTGNGQAHKEISAVDFDNNGTVDLVFHASAGSNLGSSNTRRLVYVSNQGNGSWSTTQVINDVFTLDSSTTTNTAVAMTWADFNGDGKMDLFLGAGRSGASDTQESRIFFTGGSTSPTMLGDSNPGGASVAVDWNHDGRMDVVELPSFSQTGQVLLQTNGGNGSSWTASNLLGGSNTTTGISGALAADYDWDGAVDLVYFPNAAFSTQLARNTHTVATGTSLHLRIVDAQGLTAFYGNTVQLFNSSGNLVASQILNPQSGNESSDSSSIVHFYGLSATETYTAVLLRNAGGASADVGGLASLNGNTVENVNASWTGLVAGSATTAHVLTAEAGGNSANTIGTLVGTGYNDTFYATQGTDVINGAGGWSDRYGGSPAWSSSRGEDFVDFKLAGSTGVTVNLNTAGAQNTGFNTLTLANIEGLRGGAGNDNFTASTSAIDNIFEGRGGNDTFTLTNGGHTTLVYKLLDASDPTGGNGSDTSINFGQGNITSAATADVIHLGDLLSGYTGTANTYYDTATGLNVLDAGSQGLNQFVKVTASAGTSYLYVDINGTGDFSASHLLLTMTGTGTVSLPYLLSTNQLLVSSTTALPITVNQLTTTDTTPLLTGSLPVALGDGELRITLNGKTYSSDVAGEISVASDQKTWSLTVPNADALSSGTYEVTARLVSSDGSLLARDLTSGELTITASAQSAVGAATEAAQSGALLAVTVAEDSLLGVNAASDAVDLNVLPTSGGLINLGSGLTRSMQAQQQDLTLDDLIHPVPEPGASVGAWLDNAPRADTLPPGQGAAAPPPPPGAQEAPAYDGTAHASPPTSTSLQDAWTQLGISTI